MPLLDEISSLPGVKRVHVENVLHVLISVGNISPEARKAIYEAERRLIETHRDILFNFRLVREPEHLKES